MVRESTGADTGRALELGQLIHARTGGNPFSIREFLRFLHDQNLLRFDAPSSRWTWDLAQIEAREIPSDVAALMAEELRRLPQETGELLQLAACIGVVFSFRDLSVVHGAKPERWVRQTNFDNDEAVGYLADRLARIGIEERLAKLGAEPGCLVRIGSYEFEWQPTVYAGAEFTPGHRGTDYRLEDEAHRPSAAERLATRKSRRRPYELQEQPDGDPGE